MCVHKSSPGRQAEGVVALELAVCLPILFGVLFAILNLGRMLEVAQILSNSAREAGRQASIGALSNSQITQVVTSYLGNQGIPTSNVSVSIADLTTSGATPVTASSGDALQVTVTIPTADVLWLRSAMSFVAPNQLTAQSTWCAIRGPN